MNNVISLKTFFDLKVEYFSNIEDFLIAKIPNIIIEKDYEVPDTSVVLDIYLPEYKVGINFNTFKMKSEGVGYQKKFFIEQMDICKDKEIRLLNIYEDEWVNKREVVQSVILAKLGIFKRRIYARKCCVLEVDGFIAKKFLNENHLQGASNHSIKMGLYYNGELVSLMTFGKRDITGGENLLEILRFCNSKYTTVIGGASKIFKHFLKKYNNNYIKTYADCRYSDGDLYKKLGFTFLHISDPCYWYIKDDKREHRSKYQKHKIHKYLINFDENKTEVENMKIHNFDRIWDCGCYVFEYKK